MSGRRTKVLREEYRQLPAGERGRNLFTDVAGTVRGNHFRDFKHGRQAQTQERKLFLRRREVRLAWIARNNQRIVDGVNRSHELRLAGVA